MKDQNLRLQLSLFDRDSPDGNSLSLHTQQLLTDVLSQLLRDAIDNGRDPTTATATRTPEDAHVS